MILSMNNFMKADFFYLYDLDTKKTKVVLETEVYRYFRIGKFIKISEYSEENPYVFIVFEHSIVMLNTKNLKYELIYESIITE
jgi:hypothetical protein